MFTYSKDSEAFNVGTAFHMANVHMKSIIHMWAYVNRSKVQWQQQCTVVIVIDLVAEMAHKQRPSYNPPNTTGVGQVTWVAN